MDFDRHDRDIKRAFRLAFFAWAVGALFYGALIVAVIWGIVKLVMHFT